jgi:hypothetical protein
VAADVRRVEPLERDDARPLRAVDRRLDRIDPLGGQIHEARALVRHARRGGQVARAREHLAQRGGIERQDLWNRVHLLGEGPHVVGRHRADLAQRLRDDQVGGEVAEREGVELVDGLAALGSLAYGAVDVRRSEALWDHRASEVGQLPGLWRIIALVGDRDHLLAEAEREQRLRRGGDEAGYAHGGERWQF